MDSLLAVQLQGNIWTLIGGGIGMFGAMYFAGWLMEKLGCDGADDPLGFVIVPVVLFFGFIVSYGLIVLLTWVSANWPGGGSG